MLLAAILAQSPAVPIAPIAPVAVRLTVDDITPPTVMSFRLNRDGSISIQFSKPMDPTTLNDRTVTLTSVPGPY